MIHHLEAHLLPIFLKTGNLDLLMSCQDMLVWFLWGKFSSVTLECPTISRNYVWNKTLRDMSKISHSLKMKGNFFKGFPIQMMTLLAERMKIFEVQLSTNSCQVTGSLHKIDSETHPMQKAPDLRETPLYWRTCLSFSLFLYFVDSMCL